MGISARQQKLGKTLGLICLISVLGACSAQFKNHGYIPPQEDLDQITIGVDTLTTVAETMGAPSATSVVGESSVFYVRSRVRKFAMFAPQEIDRQVVAVSFDPAGRVSNVERFGLERGQVVPLARRVTSSGVGNKTFLRQLLGSIGRFNPAGLAG